MDNFVFIFPLSLHNKKGFEDIPRAPFIFQFFAA